jgi:hypothetical protein
VLAVLGPQLDPEEVAPVGDQGIVGLLAEEINWRDQANRSTREPERLALPLEARPQDRGVHRLLEAVAHVGGAAIFDVQVELTNVKEVHDCAIVHELAIKTRPLADLRYPARPSPPIPELMQEAHKLIDEEANTQH